MNKEPFGYSEAFWEDAIEPPESPNVPGVSWLLYQRCTQNLSRFFSASDEKRDQILGRTPDASPDSPPSAGSHVDHARRATHENGRSLLQRRSFGYETYSDAGVVFLASAAQPETLKRALQSMDHDPLKTFIRLETGGIYVVPPSARWLAPSGELEKLDGDRRPPAERAFYPKSPLLLYEMTPKAREFFYRVFHANNTNFDDDAGSLREDLQVTAKGLAKMLYGARLSPTNTFFRLLVRAFTWNNAEPFLNEAVNREIEALRRDKANGVTGAALSERRAKIRKALTSTAQLERAAGDLAALSALDLFADLICDDAEFLAGSDPAKQADYDTLIELCIEAAREARAVNTKAGGYMTLVC